MHLQDFFALGITEKLPIKKALISQSVRRTISIWRKPWPWLKGKQSWLVVIVYSSQLLLGGNGEMILF